MATAVLGFVVLIAVHLFLKKRNVLLTNHLDRIVACLTVVVWMIAVYIFYNIYFRTGWDVWTIDYGAKVLLQKEGYIDWLDWYYGRYPNNILLTYVYAASLKINDLFGILDTENGQMVFVGINSLSACASAWLVYDCVKKLCNRWTAVIGWGCCVLLVCLSPWNTIPYSDALTVFIPISIFSLFLKILSTKGKKKYVLCTMLCFLGMIGKYFKPQAFIVVIAIFICGIFYVRKEKVKESVLILFFCILSIAAAQYSYRLLYHHFSEKIPFHQEAEVSWQYFLMMGLNDKSNGMWDGDDVSFSERFETKEERGSQCLKEAGTRLKELGLENYIHLVNRKIAICFSDGTFSWSRNLGDFYAEIYQEKNTLAAPLFRDFYYYDGRYYPLNATIRQICWCGILILLFCSFSVADKTKLVLMLAIVGCAIFEVVFEAATRHLYCNVPLFIVLGMTGFYSLVRFLEKLKEKEYEKMERKRV
ncbi:MAG: hypothetical protein K2N87_04085 [Eubacterium sp.]|nr:hypothetical protein [Eubacterium sp.]